jgi:DNA-binding GntR family transcriptional regulator
MPVPSGTTPIERRSARAVVLDRLTAWIENGILEPGELIKDGELAARLGVSRTPVREALQTLQQRGLVEMEPGRLTRVTEAPFEAVGSVYAPLSVLQALAAELGTPAARPRDIEKMKTHNARLLAAAEAKDPDEARDADRQFHEVLVRVAGNPYLTNALKPLMSHSRRLDALYFRDKEPGYESHREHEQIIEAVAAGDAEAASERTRQNFQRYWKPGAPENGAGK